MTQAAHQSASATPRKGSTLRRWLLALAVCAGLGGFGAELAARQMQVGDFPIYQPDAQANYVMQANQSGRFFGKYDYAINEHHMGVADRFPADGTGVLLLGDSVVLGGNQVDQADRLGPLLTKATGCKYWPISASSWALANELDRLLANPDLLRVATIVIVSNDGDFGDKSLWQDQFMQPMEHPSLVSVYALRKYFNRPDELVHFYDDTPNPARWLPQLVKLREQFKGRIVLVGYPDKTDVELNRFDKYDIAAVATLPQVKAAGTIEYVPVLGAQGWSTAMYKDSIHPTAQAYHTLSGILAPKLGSCTTATANT